MRPSRLHLTRTSLLVGASVAALVVGTAAPGAAGGAKTTVHNAGVGFSGSVTAALTPGVSTMQFKDYLSAEYSDRVVGSPGGAEVVSVTLPGEAPVSCRQTKGALKGVFIYGDDNTWASMPVGASMGSTVDVQCLMSDGQHIFRWGSGTNKDGTYNTSLTTRCVQLTRTSAEVFTLSADGSCLVQDSVINSRVQHTQDAVMRSMPFSGEITVPGLKAPATG